MIPSPRVFALLGACLLSAACSAPTSDTAEPAGVIVADTHYSGKYGRHHGGKYSHHKAGKHGHHKSASVTMHDTGSFVCRQGGGVQQRGTLICPGH